MKRNFIYSGIAIFTASILFFVSYHFAESFVVYEYKNPSDSTEEYNASEKMVINTVPEAIPQSDYYVIQIRNNAVLVKDCQNNTVYSTREICMANFTAQDIKQLEREGIVIPLRSELIELLNYLAS